MPLKCFPPSLGSIGFTVREQTWFEDFEDGYYGGHLGYRKGTILAILNLYVALMSPIKFQLNPTRFGRRYPLKIFKMADMATILEIGME